MISASYICALALQGLFLVVFTALRSGIWIVSVELYTPETDPGFSESTAIHYITPSICIRSCKITAIDLCYSSKNVLLCIARVKKSKLNSISRVKFGPL